jgi:hypothetical protein
MTLLQMNKLRKLIREGKTAKMMPGDEGYDLVYGTYTESDGSTRASNTSTKAGPAGVPAGNNDDDIPVAR